MVYLLHHLLRDSARRRPDRLAVAFRDQRRTYAQLEAETNRLAHLLRSRGIQRGDRVGIYLHKSLESVISVFGILKAGAVYVPLDPNSPPRRVAFIIQNCGVRCLVTSRDKLAALSAALDRDCLLETMVLVDQEINEETTWPEVRLVPWTSMNSLEASELERTASIETDLAYILYTSGSTGNPKGVMLTHRHALTFIDWACKTFSLRCEDRLSNHAPLHFDLSIFDIFGAVKVGAAVILVPERLSTFPIQLAQFIQEQGITVWYSVPTALTLLLLRGQLHRFPPTQLRAVLFAGEVFPVKYLRALMETIPHAAFYNLYGPTETNVCTYHRVFPLPADRTQPIPIGRACENADVFALNECGERIAIGEEGELYVRGPLVMTGYWGDAERTQRVLIPNPLQPHFEEHVYRTGDIVTLDNEENYLLLGRRDHMVKSRGYRIELGEIEATLYSHSGIREAVVVPVPDDIVGVRLRALVVQDDSLHLTPEEIKRYCAERIPHYMVPETVEFRDILPRTSTGKVDRVALTPDPS